MPQPTLSEHCKSRQPSAIRLASILFAQRDDDVEALNVAIGNVSLPMHPAMARRLRDAGQPQQPFADGVVRYTATIGDEETCDAFLNVIAASGFPTEGLHTQICDGGSQAMELITLALCGPAGSSDRPLLLIDASYTNYHAFAARLGRRTVAIRRSLSDDGRFRLPNVEAIEALIEAERPGGLVVIPYDNPTGHFYDHSTMCQLAELCVRHGMWMVSDEAYRELHYTGDDASSIWALSNVDVPGIEGRRVSIETTSKVWNACGLRIGALITDNEELHRQCVAENTAGLCSNAIGQHIFGAIAQESHDALQEWFVQQREYYRAMLDRLSGDLRDQLPGVIVSSPDASIYSVIDVRNLVDDDFDAADFVQYCAKQGAVEDDGKMRTLLTAPMAGFYHSVEGESNPGRTQMRVAYVLPPDDMQRVPKLFASLFQSYQKRH